MSSPQRRGVSETRCHKHKSRTEPIFGAMGELMEGPSRVRGPSGPVVTWANDGAKFPPNILISVAPKGLPILVSGGA